ncbi:PD-(D/E)XK nuclease family protein [Crenobacter oryzisoli]|uniref:PD-(D/E)XK nuclease family protein n=1 Tax=Crenobacter oryzisoli TaxID=3056844 RepID=UPI00339043F2
MFNKTRGVANATNARKKFFDVGGLGYLENPTSDLMALFMGSEPGVPRWLAKALFSCLVDRGLADPQQLDSIEWSSVHAEREVSAWDRESESSKRLDLVISDGHFVLGIENRFMPAPETIPSMSTTNYLRSILLAAQLLNVFSAQIALMVIPPILGQ